MSATALVYRSTDPGAPQLAGRPGSLTSLLDAVLVNGYGVGASAVAGAGWQVAFSGSGRRVYRNDPSASTGTFLQVDDSGSDPRIARVRAYESMSSLDIGTGPCPTLAQSSEGRVWVKSGSTDSEVRNWLAIATRTSIYLFTSANGVSEEGYERVALMPHFAGDISSHKEGDPSRFLLMDNAYAFYETGFVNGFTVPAGHWGNPDVMPSVGVGNIIRSYTSKDGAVPAAIAKSGNGTYSSDRLALGGVGAPFPDPVTDGLLLERALVCEGPGIVRGYLPGVYVPLHVRPFADCEIVNDVAGVDGAVLMAKATYGASGSRPVGNQGYFGQFLFDLSTPW